MEAFKSYLEALNKNLATRDASEGSHYGTLQIFVESLDNKFKVQVLPQHIKQGAPDFKVSHGEAITQGYIEAKDIGADLDAVEKSEQLKRYLVLPNLILTDYLEFRWYAEGKLIKSSRLGILKDNKIKPEQNGITETASLIEGFLGFRGKSADTPKELAQHMARLAHYIQEEIVNALKPPASGSLMSQLVAFRENLIPDLDEAMFADMYAQTITYGLFAAKLQDPINSIFSREHASNLIPKTNPFLRKTFQHIAVDLDDRVAFWVDELVELLRRSDMAAILQDFGKRTAKEDPVVHFYETFLAEYDPKLRKSRGVYYTPEPVVSYIVRSIDHLLKTRFNKPQGLADPSVLILDPAVGTATFLYMVVQQIHEAMANQLGTWDSYVAEKLLPRLFGFELLMAPYAVAHLKLGLQLKETGYTFHSDERLGVYLTNTLEEAFKKSEQLAGFNQYIVEEANAAAEIKKSKPIMVVLGNPPYSKASSNKGTWIDKLMESYKTTVRGEETQIQALSDDYVKFIRFAHWRIEETGCGIVALITNHAYLNGPLFRDMRKALLDSFSNVFILQLHGDSRIKETLPIGIKDENVFDIQQGVAISIFVKEQSKPTPACIFHADLWGTRESKYTVLSQTDISTTKWTTFKPESKSYLFSPFINDYMQEYEQYCALTSLFGTGKPRQDAHVAYGAGFVTQQDHFAIGFSPVELFDNLKVFLDPVYSKEELYEKFNFCTTNQWNFQKARQELKAVEPRKLLQQCLYRPFDYRYTLYHKHITTILRRPIMRHLNEPNLALLSTRRVTRAPFNNIFVTNKIVEYKATSHDRNTIVFPLYLYPSEQEVKSGLYKANERHANISSKFIAEVEQKLGLKFIPDGKGDLEATFGPEDIFNYAYAVLHSPTYRTRYAEFLKIDFPRLPLTSDKGLFKALAGRGGELAALHLMESPLLNSLITSYPVTGSGEVDKVSYGEKTGRVYINKTQYFEGVPLDVWNFHIGGYQVCQKWLKDRKGRVLNYDDITHYQRVIVVLKETIRLMVEIDSTIPGWPIK